MILDADEANRCFLKEVLNQEGYSAVSSFTDPIAALEEMQVVRPDLLLLDLLLPSISGLDVLRKMRMFLQQDEFIPVIVLASDESRNIWQNAFDLGATDVISKPCDRAEFVRRAENCVKTKRLYQQVEIQNLELKVQVELRTRELHVAWKEVLDRLIVATTYRDEPTGKHVERVGDLTELIARELGFNATKAQELGLAARLHDVGKISIPDSILLKPGSLSYEEMEVMKSHTTVGGQILSGVQSSLLQAAQVIALTHHEKWDGTGYPRRLREDEIPISGRICAAADVYDSLTSKRCYREAWTTKQTLYEIESNSGSHFDPDVVNALFKITHKLDSPLILRAA